MTREKQTGEEKGFRRKPRSLIQAYVQFLPLFHCWTQSDFHLQCKNIISGSKSSLRLKTAWLSQVKKPGVLIWDQTPTTSSLGKQRHIATAAWERIRQGPFWSSSPPMTAGVGHRSHGQSESSEAEKSTVCSRFVQYCSQINPGWASSALLTPRGQGLSPLVLCSQLYAKHQHPPDSWQTMTRSISFWFLQQPSTHLAPAAITAQPDQLTNYNDLRVQVKGRTRWAHEVLWNPGPVFLAVLQHKQKPP